MIRSSCAESSPRNFNVGPSTEARGALSTVRGSLARASGARGSAARGGTGARGSIRGSRGSGRAGSCAAGRLPGAEFIMSLSPSSDFLNQAISRRAPGSSQRTRMRIRLGGSLAALAVHVDAAAEARTFLDAHRGRKDVAVNLGCVLHEHGLVGVQVSFDGTFHDDELRRDVRLHRTLWPDGEPLRMGDRAFDAALDQQVFFGAEIALEIQRGTQDRCALGSAVVRVAHTDSPDRDSA